MDLFDSEEAIIAAAESINHIVRKIAHFTEYMVLCILLIIGLWVNDIRGRRMYIRAVIITAVYACTDEFHQIFIPGRYGGVTDVLLDTAGAVFGCVVVSFILRHINKRQSKSL